MNYALAVASGFLLILLFPRFNLVWLAPVAITPLLLALARESAPKRRFLLGYSAGLVYWFGVNYWIQYVLAVHGGVGEAAGWALFVLFCLAKALQMGLFGVLAGILLRRWWALPAVSSLWVALEISHEYTGFSWLPIGNAALGMGVPLRLAPWAGVYGISFVFLMTATALALAILRRPRLHMLWIALLPLLFFLPALPDARPGEESAALIQANFSETENWTRESLNEAEQQLEALSLKTVLGGEARRPALLVWPEVPAPFYEDDPVFRERIARLARAARVYLLLGVVAHSPERAPLNSAVLISPEGKEVSRYDKIKLVPFGEFVPWPLGLLARHISTEVGDFQPGAEVVVSPLGTRHLGAFICYESVFPHLVRQFAARGAGVLFNLSNDGWFGRTAARDQHILLVRMRAVENRRWILRCTNNGISAAIDPAGRMRMVLPSYVQAAARAPFSYLEHPTVYTAWGDWFAVSCALASLAFLILSRAGSPGRPRP